MKKHSLTGRLVLMFALASILIVSGSGLLLRSSLHETLRKQMHNELSFRYSLMKPWIMPRTTYADWQVLAGKFMSVANAEGGRVQHWLLSDDPRFAIGGPPPEGFDWKAQEDGFSRLVAPQKDVCSLYLLVATIPAQGERPELRYLLAIDPAPYLGTLDEFTRNLIYVSIFGVFVVVLLGFVITRVGLRPLKALSEQSHHLAPGNKGQRLDTRALPIELQQLATAFNGVLERQEIAWRQLESFNADVAHELRTPLTNIIGQTQLGLSREREVHELEEFLESNLEELERMTSIINDMLFLSHAQAGEYATNLTEVSLREEALKTAEYVEPLFAERNLSIAVHGDVTAHIDRRLFHRALANLLENSTRYGFANSQVTVTLSQQNKQAVIAVGNQGDPIEERQLTRLFERFYRADPSRTQGDKQHGLGLAIVHAVALMHHGDVFASSVDGINTFGLTMALAAANPEADKQAEDIPRASDRNDENTKGTAPLLGQE